jgi:SRSO17 transposase
MEERFAVRYEEMMAEAEVKPEALEGILQRLNQFVQPFAASLKHPAQRGHLEEYVTGLVSNVERKNIETIAYLYEQDRQPLQKFIGQKPWDWQPLTNVLVQQVGQELGKPNGVLVIDPSGFLKQGKESVGVARQWCGRAGKIDNCQVGVFMGYVSDEEQALVDMRLYLPKEWTKDRRRCRAAGIPKEVRFQTRHELALEMIRQHRAALPHAWITGDDEMGRSSLFRDKRQDDHQARLLPEQRAVRHVSVRVCEGACRGTPHRGMPATCQE